MNKHEDMGQVKQEDYDQAVFNQAAQKLAESDYAKGVGDFPCQGCGMVHGVDYSTRIAEVNS